MPQFSQLTRADRHNPSGGPTRSKQNSRVFSSGQGSRQIAQEDEAAGHLLEDLAVSKKHRQPPGFSLTRIRILPDSGQLRGHANPGCLPRNRTLTIWPVQAKLAINKPGDRYEEEADRVAEQVMRMPEPRIVNRSEMAQPPLMRRSCPKCKKKASEREDDEERLQMKPLATPARSAPREPPSSVPPIVHEVLRSSGQPLDPATQANMGQFFGRDFDQVRIHTDSKANRSAKSIGALAYTWGHNIVFRNGQYRPSCFNGHNLIAHELAHVIQQDYMVSDQPHMIAPANDEREQSASSFVRHLGSNSNNAIRSIKPAMLSLTRDTRLEQFLSAIPQLSRESVALSVTEQVERIIRLFSGVNLRDRDNLAPVSDSIARYFPEQVLFLFLQRIEVDITTASIAAEESRMQDLLRRLQAERRGAWGTVTPFPVTEVVTGSGARLVSHLGNVMNSFFEGVIEGLGGPGSDRLIADLGNRLARTSILNVVAPGVFAAGAVVGIGRDIWQGIRGLWEMITDFSGMIEKFDQLFSTIFSPAGSALSRIMGRHAGQEWRSQLVQMANYNVFRFTYELGRLIGPTIVYAVLAVLGITAEITISAIASRFVGIFRQFPAVLRIIQRIGDHLPRRRRSPISGATDAEIEAALEHMTTPSVSGGRSRPRIEGHPVPGAPRNRLDLEDIPLRQGENLTSALARVRRVIGRRLSDVPEIRNAWERARAHILSNRSLNSSNYEELYNLTRNRFWREIRNDNAAAQHFTNAGFEFPSGNTTAPILSGVRADIPITETRISLDHIAEKAIGDNWRVALDASNLRMEFAMPNTFREIVQTRHPELR